VSRASQPVIRGVVIGVSGRDEIVAAFNLNLKWDAGAMKLINDDEFD
jgi:hypothetical protein